VYERPRRFLVSGVLSGARGRKIATIVHLITFRLRLQTGYVVPALAAIEILENSNAVAGRWWRENAAHATRPQSKFLFSLDCCERVEWSVEVDRRTQGIPDESNLVEAGNRRAQRNWASRTAGSRRAMRPTCTNFVRSRGKNGRSANLQKELEDLFNSQNRSRRTDATSIPATFLRVSVALWTAEGHSDQPAKRSIATLQVTETERLLVRWLNASDSTFILELVNEPSWIRYIGDRGVKTQQDAARYIQNGPVAMYQRLGFGLYLVELKQTGEPVGMCGLIKREALENVDLGFAFLPRFWGKGYALEAASAVMSYARGELGLSRIVAVLSRDNQRSRMLLEKLGFGLEGTVKLREDDEELELYAAAA
jgi:RimJ/RimL family protein N-acetyltransferase